MGLRGDFDMQRRPIPFHIDPSSCHCLCQNVEPFELEFQRIHQLSKQLVELLTVQIRLRSVPPLVVLESIQLHSTSICHQARRLLTYSVLFVPSLKLNYFKRINSWGSLEHAGEHNGSEQTDPLQTLPTASSCWMGFWIAPFNASELIGCWFQHSGFSYR